MNKKEQMYWRREVRSGASLYEIRQILLAVFRQNAEKKINEIERIVSGGRTASA